MSVDPAHSSFASPRLCERKIGEVVNAQVQMQDTPLRTLAFPCIVLPNRNVRMVQGPFVRNVIEGRLGGAGLCARAGRDARDTHQKGSPIP
jgi:hypothetical protein